jgi:hypothetical protein
MKGRHFLQRTAGGTTALQGCFPAALTTIVRGTASGRLGRSSAGKTGGQHFEVGLELARPLKTLSAEERTAIKARGFASAPVLRS